MIKSVLIAGILLVSSLALAQQGQSDLVEESLPVHCGSLEMVLDSAKNKFGEEPVITWRDPRFGRFFVLSNESGSSVTLLVAIEGVADAVCIVSFGNEFLQAKPKPTL